MPDYQQGKIYKITYGDEVYYGSTALTLKKRMSYHKKEFKRWKNGTGSNCRSYTLFDKYGFENCPIELVEDYPCETKKELLIREDWYLKNMACINKNSAHRTEEEFREQKRQRYLDHIEEILEKTRQHYQANKEVILEKKKERFVCECGRECRRDGIAEHRKSAIHLSKLNLTL
jgi:hypothetical protein